MKLTDVVPFLVEDMLVKNGGIFSKAAAGEFLGSEPEFAEPMARPAGAMRCIAAKSVSDPNNSACGARAKRGLASTRCAQTIASPFLLDAPLLSPARTGGDPGLNWGRIESALRDQFRYAFNSCLRTHYQG